jgi:hypothetical protein
MANALTFTAAAMPAANGPLAGVIDGANSNGDNSGAWTYAGGAPGAADTIANAELLKGLDTGSRLYEVLSESYATIVAMEAAFAAVGLMVYTQGASLFYFTNAAPGVPTATCTTQVATGAVRISIAHSASR